MNIKKIATIFALVMVITLSSTAPAFAGALGGSRYGRYTLRPNEMHTFEITFRGGEYAELNVNGNRRSDLDVYIYDQSGRLIDSDDDETDYCVTEWYVYRSAVYTVKVINRGRNYNYYELSTN